MKSFSFSSVRSQLLYEYYIDLDRSVPPGTFLYKRDLPSRVSPDGCVERRSVPGGYFSELYIQVKGMLEDRVTRG